MLFVVTLLALAASGAAVLATGLQSLPDGRRHLPRVRLAGATIAASGVLWLTVMVIGIATR